METSTEISEFVPGYERSVNEELAQWWKEYRKKLMEEKGYSPVDVACVAAILCGFNATTNGPQAAAKATAIIANRRAPFRYFGSQEVAISPDILEKFEMKGRDVRVFGDAMAAIHRIAKVHVKSHRHLTAEEKQEIGHLSAWSARDHAVILTRKD